MADEATNWAGLAQWALSNPEKIALGLVIVAGAWRWIREVLREAKEDATHETFTEILMRENKELRAELRELRRRNGGSSGSGSGSGPSNGNLNDRGNDRESPR